MVPMTGDSLKSIRVGLGLAQRELAQRLGVSRALVARWEQGSLPIAKRTALAIDALAEALAPTQRPHSLVRDVAQEIKDAKAGCAGIAADRPIVPRDPAGLAVEAVVEALRASKTQLVRRFEGGYIEYDAAVELFTMILKDTVGAVGRVISQVDPAGGTYFAKQLERLSLFLAAELRGELTSYELVNKAGDVDDVAGVLPGKQRRQEAMVPA